LRHYVKVYVLPETVVLVAFSVLAAVVGRCRLTVYILVLKAIVVSALETKI
jgi:hypothetical protein